MSVVTQVNCFIMVRVIDRTEEERGKWKIEVHGHSRSRALKISHMRGLCQRFALFRSSLKSRTQANQVSEDDRGCT